MEIRSFVQVFDNVLHPEAIACLLQWLNKTDRFDKADVINDAGKTRKGVLREDIRKTEAFGLHPLDKELTSVHWFNVLRMKIEQQVNNYRILHPNLDLHPQKVEEINALRYKPGGFYKYHTDYHIKFPRVLSTITLLNNDYKGGQLCFRNPSKEEDSEFCIDVKPGRMIMWPSNFLYPHAIKPITEGTRYSIVGWVW